MCGGYPYGWCSEWLRDARKNESIVSYRDSQASFGKSDAYDTKISREVPALQGLTPLSRGFVRWNTVMECLEYRKNRLNYRVMCESQKLDKAAVWT